VEVEGAEKDEIDDKRKRKRKRKSDTVVEEEVVDELAVAL
jgi:hypothetical protein